MGYRWERNRNKVTGKFVRFSMVEKMQRSAYMELYNKLQLELTIAQIEYDKETKDKSIRS